MNQGQRASLNQMMAKLADGDRSVFDEIYSVVFPVIRSFAVKYVQHSSDRDDIAQETLAKIFSQAHKYQKSSDALSWVLTIAAFECKTLRQKYRRRREDHMPADSAISNIPDGRNTEHDVIDEDLRKAAIGILSELKVQDQETILAAILETAKPDIPAATFRKRLQRSIATLRSAWEAKYEL